MADDAEVSLRPVVLGPGGPGNPFSNFGKGAGFGMKAKKATAMISVSDDTSTRKDGKRVKYGKEFLMQFMERYSKCPLEVTQLGMTEIVVSGDEERDAQRLVLQKVAEDIDDRDWRTRDALPPGADAQPRPQETQRDGGNWEKSKEQQDSTSAVAEAPTERKVIKQQPPTVQPQQAAAAAAAAATNQAQQPTPANGTEQDAPKVFVRAADVGLQAYKPGAQLTAEQRAHRTIKGILNKLTPEKFERLLQQLLEVITTADVLKHTISLVFENAVEQPTYCAMYADLCLRLSKELPSFPPPTGSDKAISFRQILLNTCQDEFEGTELARENLTKMTETHEREAAERNVKKRTMGNMRLISELYKQDMVKDWIMTQCMEDLLVAPKNKVPPEDNIEAACEMVTTAGARLSKSERPETRRKLEDVMKALEKLGADSRNVAARIRFIIKDIMDLKRSNWIPRREVFTAKKLDEVRAQAEAELGMISSTISLALPTLPTQQRMGGIMGGGGPVDDIPLIPPLRSGDTEGWGLFPPLRSEAGAPGAGASKSALLGEYVQPSAAPAQAPVAAAAPAPTPAPAAAAPSKPAPVGPGGLSEAALKSKTEALFSEFTSTLDNAEAALCVRELQAPEYMPKLVEYGLEQVLNSVKEKEQTALVNLILHLHEQGLVTSTDIMAGLATYAVQLEDLSMDFPKAPTQLGHFVGLAINAQALGMDVLPQLLEGDYGIEPKRELAAAAFAAIQSAPAGAEGLAALCSAAGLHAGEFLKADATLDPSAPSVEEWLKSTGFSAVPL